jgi:hypothetical protein
MSLSCLPDSGGCERGRTDPFVAHLNVLEDSHFEHEACLDVLDRTSPQPEALYVDTVTSVRMVIERKAIIWPPNYPQTHKNDHFLAQTVTEALRAICQDQLYALVLEPSVEGRPTEVDQFAKDVIRQVGQEIGLVRAGRSIGSRRPGRRWCFRLQNAWERYCHPLKSGLVVFWCPESDMPELCEPESIPEALQEVLRRIFASCSRKFAPYPDARKVLLIDPHGDLRHAPVDWFARLFGSYPPPKEIDFIWLGVYDWLLDDQQGWMFDKVYSRESGQAAEVYRFSRPP